MTFPPISYLTHAWLCRSQDFDGVDPHDVFASFFGRNADVMREMEKTFGGAHGSVRGGKLL